MGTLQVETKPVETRQTQRTQNSGKLALPGNRPIGTTNLKYNKTISNRPIASTGLQIEHTMSASGIRPIGTNNLEVSKQMMNRPVASNQIDNEGLMGFFRLEFSIIIKD